MTYTVFVEGVLQQGPKTVEDVKSYLQEYPNIVLAKSNGYSHFWSEIEPFNQSHFQRGTIHLTCRKPGHVQGSSEVSFS